MSKVHLGVNIDHIAAIRNARGENDPSLIEMLFEVESGGADLITMHLREDRRHITDDDLFEVKRHTKLPVNFEMALTDKMLQTALRLKPSSICLVPEKREEITTEGGLDVKPMMDRIQQCKKQLDQDDIELFLFIEPGEESVYLSQEAGVSGVEVHAGRYARSFGSNILFQKELDKIKSTAELCEKSNLLFHAGHGLNYHNIKDLLEIQNLKEVNIGHSLIAHSLKVGLKNAVKEMKNLLRHP